MPFTTVTDLPANPDVRIFFTGLLILDPNPTDLNPDPGVNSCEVFVHRSAPDHQLTIEVRRKRPGKPDVIMMRHVGQLAFLPPPDGVDPRLGMRIQVNKNPKGVRRYDPQDTANPSPEGEGLSLAIDLKRLPALTADVGPVSPQGGRPSILFNDAIFYTAAKSPKDVEIKLKKDGVIVQTLPPFASVIGANIYLDADAEDEEDKTAVILNWVQQGLPQQLALMKPTKPEDAGQTYEIYIVNEPLYESELSSLPTHDELKEYFKILPEAKDRYELEAPKVDAEHPHPDRGSTTTPCMSVLHGG